MTDYTWYFTEAFSDNAQILYELLFTKDFDPEALKAKLDSGIFSPEDINMAAYRYVDDCHEADINAYDDHSFDAVSFGETIQGIESSHLVEAIRILVDYGLNPNKIYVYDDGGQTNIMKLMMFVYNGYQSADAVAIMFEHGGDPSLIIEDVSLIRDLNYELLYFLYNEDYRYFSDSVVHYWMVFIGYGAKLEHGEESIDPVGDFDIANLRNHRQYYYGVIHSDRSNDGIEVCFFDKDTNIEVARY